MKTEEFIERVEEIGCESLNYEVVQSSIYLAVVVKDFYETVAVDISKIRVNTISFKTGDYDLIKLCLEYAETPIEEREEPKLYTVVLPDSLKRGRRVYALGKLVEHEDEVIIQKINLSTLENPRCRLTEEEIKCNHGYLYQFAKEVEQ